MTRQPASVGGFRTLILCGFVLAGVLTLSLALSLRLGNTLHTILSAALLWLTVSLIHRNTENMARALKDLKAADPSGRKEGEELKPD
jgi:predicted tellurium resistance membrane protein TerC